MTAAAAIAFIGAWIPAQPSPPVSYTHLVGAEGAPELVDAGGVLCSLGILTRQPANQLQAATNAQLTVDGIAVSRSSNSISDLIPGVTLDLMKADPNTRITVTVGQDSAAVYDLSLIHISQPHGFCWPELASQSLSSQPTPSGGVGRDRERTHGSKQMLRGEKPT